MQQQLNLVNELGCLSHAKQLHSNHCGRQLKSIRFQQNDNLSKPSELMGRPLSLVLPEQKPGKSSAK